MGTINPRIITDEVTLPDLGQLKENESTYITFSTAHTDFDRAVQGGTEYYMSKMVALELPLWRNSSNPNEKFYADLSSVGIVSDNPNLVIPKMFQYYMENILRNSIGVDGKTINEQCEIALWKTFAKMGLDYERRQDLIRVVNGVFLSNYIEAANNQGWCEIVTQVPNKCKLLKPAWKPTAGVANIVQSSFTDTAIYDNGNKQFTFTNDQKMTLDFEGMEYDDVTQQEIKFNVLILFYRDKDGVDKLHGINFINPFEYNISFWDLINLKQKTNIISNIGYQFLFNFKSVNNPASKTAYYELNEQMFYNDFERTLTAFNSFLYNQTKIKQ